MSDEAAIVVGGGPGALRAAAALAQAGRPVTLLQEGPYVGSLADPGVPVGRGGAVSPGHLAERLYGTFHEVRGTTRAIRLEGRTCDLPLSRAEIARLFPATGLPSAAVAWTRTRGATELRKLIGGGFEERTYRDWVVHRFGAPVFERLYASYCQARFGPPDEISCSVARHFHGTPETGPLMAPAAGPGLAAVGVDVRTDVVVRAVGTGRVETEEGTFEGEVFLDVAPRRVVDWLGSAASDALRNDARFLHARYALEVLVRLPGDLPFETHILDRAPFFRLVRVGRLPGCESLADFVSVQHAVEEGDPLLRASDDEVLARTVDALTALGFEGASDEGGRVQRIRDHHPVWANNHLVRMRRYVLALEELELVPVGRAGLHAPLDLAQEMAWLEGILAPERPSLRSLARAHVEPPARDTEERAHLTRFVER